MVNNRYTYSSSVLFSGGIQHFYYENMYDTKQPTKGCCYKRKQGFHKIGKFQKKITQTCRNYVSANYLVYCFVSVKASPSLEETQMKW